jgi:hypothetical protein
VVLYSTEVHVKSLVQREKRHPRYLHFSPIIYISAWSGSASLPNDSPPFFPTFLILISTLHSNHLFNMPWDSLNPGLDLLLCKVVQHFSHRLIASARLFGAPFFVVALFIHGQHGSIGLRSGELPHHNKR